jgi:hypothetical protein
MDEIEVEDASISGIIKELKKEEHSRSCNIENETWFRGQANYRYKLVPSIFRINEFKADKYNEAEIYQEFIRRYPEHSNSHKNIFEWLTLMQHYGLPTRLLDWTTNLLVALFFAVKDEKHEDGAVFAFNPGSTLTDDHNFRDFLEVLITSKSRPKFYEKLIKVTHEKYGEKATVNNITIKEWLTDDIHLKLNVANDIGGASEFKSFQELGNMPSINHVGSVELVGDFSSVYRFKPPHLNSRIKVQHGCFTLHGGKYFKELPIKQGELYEVKKFIKPNKMEDYQSGLIKVKIKAKDKDKFLEELKLIGITESTIYPEMEYQTKYIKQQYKIL